MMHESVRKQLIADQEKHIAFLKRMVSYNSSVSDMGASGKEADLQRFIEQKLRDLGAVTDVFHPSNEVLKGHPEFNSGHCYEGRPNVVGTFYGAGGGPSLLINAHADVVPEGDLNAWICPPYEPRIIDGRLYGRGSCDMKAGGAAALMALETLKLCGIRLKGNVIFESVVDEEGGGNGTLACCLRGYSADAAIIPEPTELKLMPAHMGWLFYRVTFKGKPLHCAFKWDGVNAIEKCLYFMQKMQELEKNWAITKRHPYLPPPTICFTVINGGNSSSTVPERCSLDMSVHFHPCETIDERIGCKIEAELMHEIDNYISSDDWLRDNPPSIEKFQQGSAYDIGSNHPIVKCAAESLRDITGLTADVSGLASGADARLINNYANTPTLICGPGSIGDAHSVNEYVEIDQYLNAIAFFCDILVRWCGAA